MAKRIIVACIFVPVMLWIMLIPPPLAWTALVCFISAMAAFELLRAVGEGKITLPMQVVTILSAALLPFGSWADLGMAYVNLVAFVVMAVCFSVGLFMLLPTFLASFVEKVTDSVLARNLADAALRVALFMSYMIAVSRMKDIRRVFSYHGAEHKTIFCYEKRLELTVENVRAQPKHHPRCGTSFMLVVIIVAILVNTVVFALFPVDNVFLRMAVQLLLLPLVVGITYEFNRYVGGHDNPVTNFLARPGLWMQNFTTFEPDDAMIEVAIEAMRRVIPQEEGKDSW